jgi:hypothetical protein
MAFQYLQNDAGETTAVVIPIEDWKTITETYNDLANWGKTTFKKNKKASDYKGLLSPTATEAFQQHVQQSREQWE